MANGIVIIPELGSSLLSWDRAKLLSVYPGPEIYSTHRPLMHKLLQAEGIEVSILTTVLQRLTSLSIKSSSSWLETNLVYRPKAGWREEKGALKFSV